MVLRLPGDHKATTVGDAVIEKIATLPLDCGNLLQGTKATKAKPSPSRCYRPRCGVKGR